VVEMDRSLTHEPSAVRYWNRVFWEALRFALPIMPLLVLIGWYRTLAGTAEIFPMTLLLMVVVPLVTFGAAAFLCLFILALKWILLGRVRPGQHALWSCWCSRWDFLYVAWGQHARFALEKLEGTLLLNWYLRAMGMNLGKRVVLGPGFSQVVDPDMIVIEDGATVNAMFQAHTFEDRVLKTDHVVIRRNATLGSATVPLYGAEIGERTHVAAHSVIMKRECLLPGLLYEGAPCRTRTRSL
jgi:non-ribosomal peptide synthetase-like protein